MKVFSSAILFWVVSFALASSPSGGYAPGAVQCPSKESFIREGNSISQEEADWIKERQEKSNQALISFLDSANLTGFNAARFVNGNSSSKVNLGLAFSGGGYRAMLSGAGQLLALDNRTDFGDNNVGGLGGLLQSANYISALSGGAWLLGSLAMQDFKSVQEVVFENPDDLWNLTSSRQLVNQTGLWTIILPVILDNLNGALTHLNFWNNDKNGIQYDIQEKEAAGFNTSITDPWARGLAHQLFPKGDDNFMSAATWSDIRNMSSFSNHEMPFPMVVALGRRPGTLVYNLNSTVVEINPFEIGSFDPSLNSFTDLKYIGSKVTNGVPDSDTCIEGFDNAGFVIGTSSSLFNQFLNTLVCPDCSSLPWYVKPFLKSFLTKMSNTYEDIAEYSPNPFYKSEFANSSNIADNDTLYLFDGGIAGEIIPLSTLMTKERALDVVVAFDNGNDGVTSWPNGSALVSTYERQFSKQGSSTVCPYIPDEVTFLTHNLTARPTFFGCDSKNLTDLVKDGVTPPLVIYIANRPYEFYSNTSTFQLTYTDEDKKSMIKNGFDVTTRLNGTIDEEWKTCVACAVIRREEERRGIEQSDQCKQCFKNYCWDGSLSTSSGPYYQDLNFTDSGLTNGSEVFYGPPPPPASSGSFLSSIFKRSESVLEIKITSGSSSLISKSSLGMTLLVGVVAVLTTI
ncbi:phospholipase B [Scheffersomyces xylosifermentans]|uniref:phospholipase B n=1 Tax=Scheffersomyces xylosifermentans TaxID=1304137 RepID=UPI00315DE785